jgi:hypothetical protein
VRTARPNPDSGVSLIEVLVASAVMMVVVGGLVSLFITQNHAYKVQSDMVEARASLRTGMDFIERDLKNLGLPAASPVDIVCEATATRFSAHGLLNSDDLIDKVVYEFVPGAATPGPGRAPGTLFRRFIDGADPVPPGPPLPDCTIGIQGSQEVLSENVMNLTFTYYDDTILDAGGNPIVPPGRKMSVPVNQGNLYKITRVQIRMDVVTNEDPQLRRTTARVVDIDPTAMTRLGRLLTIQSQVCLRTDIFQL